MSTRRRPLSSFAAAALALLVGCEGCGEQMRIIGVRDEAGLECAPPVDSAGLRARGLMDLRGESPSYQGTLVVEGAELALTIDASRVFFTDEDLREVGALPTIGAPRVTRLGQPVELGDGGRADVALTLVEASEARAIAEALGGALGDPEARTRVLVWLTLAGTLGELSNEVTFPVDVCRGCLIGKGTLDGTTCVDDGLALVTYDVCRVGQDEVRSVCE